MEYRILIVEDDTVIADGIAAYLKSWGFVAEQVKDFRQVMEAAAAPGTTPGVNGRVPALFQWVLLVAPSCVKPARCR